MKNVKAGILRHHPTCSSVTTGPEPQLPAAPAQQLLPRALQGLAQASCSRKCLQAAEFPSHVSSCSSLSQLCSLFPQLHSGAPRHSWAPLPSLCPFDVLWFVSSSAHSHSSHPRCLPALAQGSGLWLLPPGGNCHSSGTSASVLLGLLGCSVRAAKPQATPGFGKIQCQEPGNALLDPHAAPRLLSRYPGTVPGVMLWQRLLEMQEIQKFQLYLEDPSPSSSHCCQHLCCTQRNGFSAIWLFCSGS